MISIYWDEDTRSFASTFNQKVDVTGNIINKPSPTAPTKMWMNEKQWRNVNKRATSNMGRDMAIGSAAMGVIGGLSGRYIARKRARAEGLSDAEVRAAGRKGLAVGALGGAAVGAGATFAGKKGLAKLSDHNFKALGSLKDKRLHGTKEEKDRIKNLQKLRKDRKEGTRFDTNNDPAHLRSTMGQITKNRYELIKRKKGAKVADAWLQKRPADARMMSED